MSTRSTIFLFVYYAVLAITFPFIPSGCEKNGIPPEHTTNIGELDSVKVKTYDGYARRVLYFDGNEYPIPPSGNIKNEDSEFYEVRNGNDLIICERNGITPDEIDQKYCYQVIWR